MIAVTFALPEESRDFLRATRGRDDLKVIHTGMGLEAAAKATAMLLANSRPSWVLSGGFAGALDPRLRLGDVILAENLSSPELIARFPGNGHRGKFVSRPRPAELVEEKAALFRETGALAVDMETEAIAAACRNVGVPLLCMRAISDTANEPLPAPLAEWFDLARQRPRPRRLLAYLCRRPSAIWPFMRFVRGLPVARRALTTTLLSAIDH